jgi:dipeptidase D
VLEQSGEAIKLTISVRSCVGSVMEDLARRVEALAGLAGATSVRTGGYPAWRYEAESKIRELCVGVYRELSGRDPRLRAIHAGLECGLLKEKLPRTDMISFGPNLAGVHTPDESLSINSVAATWEFLTTVLARCDRGR